MCIKVRVFKNTEHEPSSKIVGTQKSAKKWDEHGKNHCTLDHCDLNLGFDTRKFTTVYITASCTIQVRKVGYYLISLRSKYLWCDMSTKKLFFTTRHVSSSFLIFLCIWRINILGQIHIIIDMSLPSERTQDLTRLLILVCRHLHRRFIAGNRKNGFPRH